MSKKFKGKLCAYCIEAMATTGDHVFAREFFLAEDRSDLPKAPACRKCNEVKSRLEHYLTTVLPFGGRHARAAENLSAHVPRRLERNRKLQRQISSAIEPVWLRSGQGLYQHLNTIPFDGAKMEKLLEYVARGLAWHHWDLYLRQGDEVAVWLYPDNLSATFQSIIGELAAAQKVENNIGNGSIIYGGMQAVDPPQLTVWAVSMYGGVMLADSDEAADGQSGETSTVWWMVTGPPGTKSL